MLVPLFLAVALVTAATPTPEPSSSGVPLREIGHVYSNGACTAIVVRANNVISTALRNDQTVTLLVSTLHTVDLDSSNRVTKIKGLKELERYADDLRLSAVRAGDQIKQLRQLAKESADPVRKDELTAFADALGGALGRQQRIGAEMQGMLARIAGRDSVAETYALMEHTSPDLLPPWNWADVDFHKSVYNKMAVNEANYFELQVPSIQDDESKAADHVVGAVNGC